MFASIVNFSDYFKQMEEHENGEKCLKLLNEIIFDIDNASIRCLMQLVYVFLSLVISLHRCATF